MSLTLTVVKYRIFKIPVTFPAIIALQLRVIVVMMQV